MQIRGRAWANVLGAVLLAGSSAAGALAYSRLTASPSSVNFGNQIIGTSSAAIQVVLTNTTSRKITISKVSTSLSQFSYTGPSMPVTMGARQSMSVTVSFLPTAAQAYSGYLIFTRKDGGTLDVELAGTGIQTQVQPPSITTQPTSQTITAGQMATFSVAASGTAPLSYQWNQNGAAISGATSSSYTTPAETTAANGTQFTVTVRNSAGAVNSNPATLTVNAAAAAMSVGAAGLSFGNVNVGTSNTLTDAITNSGSVSITVSNVSVAGAGFTATGVSSGQILAAGQTATLAVTFAPSSAGGANGSVTITSNASNSPLAISLSGTGTTSTSNSVSLTWDASLSAVNGYNVYRGTTSGGPYALLTASPVSATSYTDTSLQSSTTYYYVVTSIDTSGMESAYSNQASASVP